LQTLLINYAFFSEKNENNVIF